VSTPDAVAGGHSDGFATELRGNCVLRDWAASHQYSSSRTTQRGHRLAGLEYQSVAYHEVKNGTNHDRSHVRH